MSAGRREAGKGEACADTLTENEFVRRVKLADSFRERSVLPVRPREEREWEIRKGKSGCCGGCCWFRIKGRAMEIKISTRKFISQINDNRRGGYRFADAF